MMECSFGKKRSTRGYMGATDRPCQPMFSHVTRCIIKPAIGGRISAKYAVKCYLPLPAEYCLCLYIMEVKKDEKGNHKGRAEGYRDQRLARPLSPGMPNEVVKSI